MHRCAAIVLSDGAGPGRAGSVALHWHRAGGPDVVAERVRWAVRAGDEARGLRAFDDAAGFAALAVRANDGRPPDAPRDAELLIRLAEARYLAGRVGDAVEDCVRAADLAEPGGRSDLLARAALVVHGVGDPATLRTVVRLSERALRLLPPTAHATRARLRAQLAVGMAEASAGEAPEVSPAGLAADALAEAELSGDGTAVLEALAARHQCITGLTTVAERLELGRRAVELGDASSRPIAALWGHLWRAEGALQLGNMVEFRREVAAVDDIARYGGSALARWHHHRWAAVIGAFTGDFAQARAENAAGRALATRMGDVSGVGMSIAFGVQLALVRRDGGEIDPCVDEFVRAAPPLPIVRLTTPIVHALAGRMDEARVVFEPLRPLVCDYRAGLRWTATIYQLGLCAELLGDAETAGRCYELLASSARQYAVDGSGLPFFHGSLARVLAGFALISGRTDDAVRLFREGLAMDTRIGARPYVALGRLGLAKALLAAGGRDLTEAAASAAAACAELRRLDMAAPGAQAAALVAEIAARRRAASPLTPREEDVVRLVARAMTNREIAAELVLSERTVETHVRNVLAKLGLASRTEIAVWALRS